MTTDLADALTAYRAALRPPAPTGRRGHRRVLAGTALLLAVLAGGAAAAVLPGNPPTPGRAPQLVAGATPAPAPATSTPTAAAPDAAPMASAPPTTWRRWTSPALTTWLPDIPGAGPTDPGRLAGFARTPEGALAAALSLHPAIYYTRDQAIWIQLADTRVTWADGQRDQLADALAAEWDTAGTNDYTTAAPVGYRLITYHTDRAEFRLWWRWQFPGDATPILGALVTVLWDGTDWRLWFDEPAMDMRPLEARDSYQPWGPA